jgi:hypothetical protein
VLCEDGSGTEYVHGLTTGGIIFKFAQNNVDLRSTPVNAFSADYRGSEFAGFQAEIAEGTEGTGSTRRHGDTEAKGGTARSSSPRGLYQAQPRERRGDLSNSVTSFLRVDPVPSVPSVSRTIESACMAQPFPRWSRS